MLAEKLASRMREGWELGADLLAEPREAPGPRQEVCKARPKRGLKTRG